MRLKAFRIAAMVSAIGFLVISLAGALSMAQARPQDDNRPMKLDAKDPIAYFIADGSGKAGYRSSDRELALWALQAWQKAVGKDLQFVAVSESKALVRLYWAAAGEDEFGETQPLTVDGRRGAAVYIVPDIAALGPQYEASVRKDDLLRESIVYLTCLHELGHALGLEHTKNFRDIMYSFGYGGNISEYFGRYRAQVHNRSDIAKVSGLSDADIARIKTMYAVK